MLNYPTTTSTSVKRILLSVQSCLTQCTELVDDLIKLTNVYVKIRSNMSRTNLGKEQENLGWKQCISLAQDIQLTWNKMDLQIEKIKGYSSFLLEMLNTIPKDLISVPVFLTHPLSSLAEMVNRAYKQLDSEVNFQRKTILKLFERSTPTSMGPIVLAMIVNRPSLEISTLKELNLIIDVELKGTYS